MWDRFTVTLGEDAAAELRLLRDALHSEDPVAFRGERVTVWSEHLERRPKEPWRWRIALQRER